MSVKISNSRELHLQAILSGFLIGIGDIAIMQNDNKYVGALLFSLALLAIIHNGIPLYTGRIGGLFYMSNYAELIVILFWNVVGCCLALLMFIGMQPDRNFNLVNDVADKKFGNMSIASLFIAGYLCNVLIHVAVATRDNFVTVLCIMAFIVSGFRHSIADAGFAVISMNHVYLMKWAFVLLGNTVGGIFNECLLSPDTVARAIKIKKEFSKT